MFLDVWMKKNKKDNTDLAIILKCSYLKAYRIKAGITPPKLEDVVAIGDWTDLAVAPDDLLAKLVKVKNNK
jgi:hypothetical protein